ncbi:hypothetical protein Ancab_018402 [Ancistrocladus abbreviatus]
MDEMKGKFKDFVKKVNNPFTSSSSGKFKGQGRVLGSSSSGPTNPILARPAHLANSASNSNPRSVSSSNSTKPSSQKTPVSDRLVTNSFENHEISPQKGPNSERVVSNSLKNHITSSPNRPQKDGFYPYDSLITTGKRNKSGYSLNVFECPVCNGAFSSEEEVSIHIESCLGNQNENGGGHVVFGSEDGNENHAEVVNKLETCFGAYLSGKPSEGSVDVVIRLLRNVVKEPENVKFRRIRMSNPKIREAIGEVAGAFELLETVGFQLKEDEGEMWTVMDLPSEENILMIKKLIPLLESHRIQGSTSSVSVKVDEPTEPDRVNEASDAPVEPKVIDRQIKVFFSVPESVAAKIELPESFYSLSVQEVKREAELRKKKIAESELLIPKSYKEKQAKAARRRYTKSVIRIQFPDGVVLQGVFYPWEPTSILYEFVGSALKQPGLEFELLHPVPVKRRVIPCFSQAGGQATTLEEEDLVPSALVKFKPLETDSIVFTGLRNELLEISEPLVSNS